MQHRKRKEEDQTSHHTGAPAAAVSSRPAAKGAAGLKSCRRRGGAGQGEAAVRGGVSRASSQGWRAAGPVHSHCQRRKQIPHHTITTSNTTYNSSTVRLAPPTAP